MRFPQRVGLVAGTVPADRREVLREVLAAAGVRVEAGAAFSVAFQVEAPGGLDLSGVPDSAQAEYYELEVREDGATVRAAGADGLLWGARTLADVFRAASAGAAVPGLRIRDWPDLANRGIFVEDKWGSDRMELADWKRTVDRLAALKMNRMGIGLYGCWGNCRYEDRPTEFLMVPVPGHPELRNEHRLRWYSPSAKAWRDETYLPRLSEGDFLGEIVAYGKQRGVTVIPFVNSLGHNTFIPRVLPEVSAKDEAGTPLGIGYCLSSPKLRAFIEGFYGSILDRYFPDGADFFHIQLDEVWPDNADPADPLKRVDPWCKCPDCRAREREQNLQAYIVWLVGMLTRKGVRKVLMWNDQLTRHMDALDDSFLGKLREAGLADRLILHWWWYSNEALNEKTRVSIGRKLGLPGWVAPMTCYYNWMRYSTTFRNIDLMLAMARDEGAEGAVSYAVHDPGWTDHEMLQASYAWNAGAVSSPEDQRAQWAAGRFGQEAPRFLVAMDALLRAASTPALAHTYAYTYSYARQDQPFPRPYPGEALQKMEGMDGDVPAQLREAAGAAREAAAGFEALAEIGTEDDRACVRSLRGEAARIEGLATAFAFLVSARQSLSGGKPDPDLSGACGQARTRLLEAMAAFEVEKPTWVVPASLQALSLLLAFLDQLRADLEEVGAGTRRPDAVRWQSSVPYPSKSRG